jgi:hypothetical protein
VTEALVGRAASSPIPSSTSLFQDRDATVSLTFSSLSEVNERALAVGSAAATPATFGALHGAFQLPLAECAPLQVRLHPGGGGFDVYTTLEVDTSSFAAMVPSEHLYACLFAVDPAISGSVPDLVIDLGVIN